MVVFITPKSLLELRGAEDFTQQALVVDVRSVDLLKLGEDLFGRWKSNWQSRNVDMMMLMGMMTKTMMVACAFDFGIGPCSPASRHLKRL